MIYKKRNFAPHGETDRKQSWYWSVLLNNYGSYKKAEEKIHLSRQNTDPLYLANQYLKEKFWVHN